MMTKETLPTISPEIANELSPGSVWQHRKGSFYFVMAIGYIEATLTPAVIYRSHADLTTWIRPLTEFMDGRFKRIR